MTQKIGYGRVSTFEQNLSLQLDALTQAGCIRIFQDKASGATVDRSGLQEALNYLRPGDTLIVWRLDRLGRSLKNLIELIGNSIAKTLALKACKKTLIRLPVAAN